MKASDAIRMLLEDQGRTQRSFALELGITPQGLDQRLKSKTMKVETLCEMAAQLGYGIRLVPEGGTSEGIDIAKIIKGSSEIAAAVLPFVTTAIRTLLG